jgi:hypothetical protein
MWELAYDVGWDEVKVSDKIDKICGGQVGLSCVASEAGCTANWRGQAKDP